MKAGDRVVLQILLPPWVNDLPADSQQAFHLCVGRAYEVAEIDAKGLCWMSAVTWTPFSAARCTIFESNPNSSVWLNRTRDAGFTCAECNTLHSPPAREAPTPGLK